jgi:hypothetical protein
MRFNPDTETKAFASVDAAAIDLSTFPALKSNDVVWDCQQGRWTLSSELMNLLSPYCQQVVLKSLCKV